MSKIQIPPITQPIAGREPVNFEWWQVFLEMQREINDLKARVTALEEE